MVWKHRVKYPFQRRETEANMGSIQHFPELTDNVIIDSASPQPCLGLKINASGHILIN